ncbi:MAG: glycosyltransferase family 9 protein [Prevotella sp.]|nr:glycosyltransferase family 9 protein [Prevotella sp.]
MRTEHVLIIRFSALGDIAMTVPVVYSLAHQYPHVRFTVLSRKMGRPLFEDLAPNVGFMEADLKTEYRGIKGLNSLYRRLAAKHFTAVADLHHVLRSDYLRTRFNMDRYRTEHVDKHRKGKNRLTRSSNKQLVQLPSTFQNYVDVFTRLGYPIKLDFHSIFPPEGGDLTLLPEDFREKPSTQYWIGIAPFAAHEGKIYPLSLMKQVIQQLLEHHPHARIFFFGGGKKEFAVFDEWVKAFPQCTNASKHLSGLRQEMILMSHLDVMVSMDSANMHLASLTGIPVVSVWGATHPYAGFAGWGQSIEKYVQLDLPCRPCSIYGNKPCMRGDLACMQHISPDMIVEKVEHIFNQL